MNDERRRQAPPATNQHGADRSNGIGGTLCVRCKLRPAKANRRLPSYTGTWAQPERVCGKCAAELDELSERCARGVGQVDRAVERFRGRLAA